MKIGIVTQPLSRNYGGILQNYALQQTLIKLGHIPYTFDTGSYTWIDWCIITFKYIIKRILLKKCEFPITPLRKNKREYPLRRFVECYINLMKPRCKRLNASLIDKYHLDAIIVGSDQVWRPMYNYNILDMYLDFAKTYRIKRIAYAASFGTDFWEYNKRQEFVCKSLISKFDAISVRENTGVYLCENYLNVNAEHVIDPTLLLSSDDYNQLIKLDYKKDNKLLFAYILDRDDDKIQHINKIAAQLGLNAIIKGADDDLSENDSIEKWLSYFRDAQYVITDSFHGCAFSIIYNVDFHALGNINRGLTRMSSLLKSVGLINRLVTTLKMNDYIVSKVNWSCVNDKLYKFQRLSYQFLFDALK